MKIRKIRYVNNPVFGDLQFDFTNDGQAVNTIIIAGENGVGKSVLLNDIFEFTNLSIKHGAPRKEVRIFEIELSNEEVDILKKVPGVDQYFNKPYKDNIFFIKIDYDLPPNWNQIEIRGNSDTDVSPVLASHIFSVEGADRVLRAVFSDVEINFTAGNISTVTSTNIDREGFKTDRSHSNMATEISQLLVDIQSLDALEFTEWAKSQLGKPIDPAKMDLRMKRFTTAFEYMFPRKRYKRIQTIDNHKEILFEENGKEMSINKLSSGEKQIVFRGGFLLRNIGRSKGAIILIDEPELSLHPNWQLKILSFFKRLFTDDSGRQSSQIIVATHSPFIIHNADRSDDMVIILEKTDAGLINIPTEPRFPAWSADMLVERAFNVTHEVANNRTTIFVGGVTDEMYFRQCLKCFSLNSPVDFKWIGRINEQGKAEFTGDPALDTTTKFFLANPSKVKGKIILFYDSDTNKPEKDYGDLLVRTMHRNLENCTFKKGIENLLVIPSEMRLEECYSIRTKTDDYGGERTERTLDKVKLAKFICEQIPVETQRVVLKNLHQEVLRLLSELKLAKQTSLEPNTV